MLGACWKTSEPMPGWATAKSAASEEELVIRKVSFRPMNQSGIADVECSAGWPDALMAGTVMKLDLTIHQLNHVNLKQYLRVRLNEHYRILFPSFNRRVLKESWEYQRVYYSFNGTPPSLDQLKKKWITKRVFAIKNQSASNQSSSQEPWTFFFLRHDENSKSMRYLLLDNQLT